jgi:hypothetical protein
MLRTSALARITASYWVVVLKMAEEMVAEEPRSQQKPHPFHPSSGAEVELEDLSAPTLVSHRLV